MSDLMKYGIALAPRGVVNELLTGWMNAWFINVKDPKYRLRERSRALHNAIDNALGQYLAQLRQDLKKLRQALPEPTRENPYPPLEGLAAVKEMEQYIRRVEQVRTIALSAPIPPDEYVFHGTADNEQMLYELLAVDGEIATAMQSMDETTIDQIEAILVRRNALLQQCTTP
ncbi:hypothetical protein URH17368_1936 [Alicyclobacillus hesperidum URH17-3-68]|uniref:Plus3 domain-containing protein n=1 Tax=Alicyclobacillus hesperidum TaxID=89784 RepID=A0A1H2QS50_9BACL|nr:hypothetical protein [Alicyclobacillus hesperidum]EJY55551.1 hypothetical protein URH17368_1936 [Alicyclobacillus hesperidum URH17-3-68]GLV13339.1 hypothetical protein Heshes_10230 [Alicyclobacillus hesperidum]SDW09434.1 hypothetical protein SAMN04489725_1028 [Alicyclobacillus hesperidum]